jgi:hypothetical protein
MTDLGVLADIAQIATAVIAAAAYISYRYSLSKRRTAVERYLKNLVRRNDLGANARRERTIAELIPLLGLTPEQVLEAVFASKNLRCKLIDGPGEIADRLVLRYGPNASTEWLR